jgi:chemotaxis protein methyltransferase CheR
MITDMAGSWANEIDLTMSQFASISKMVGKWSGINLHQGKMALVKARLNKRMRMLGLTSFDQYVDRISADVDGSETAAMLDAISTNLTHFFREPKHFDLLQNRIIPNLLVRRQDNRRIRIWSAGCSSGEEPYSIAITLNEMAGDLADWDVGILATDLSGEMIKAARAGLYRPEQLRETSARRIQQNFTPCRHRSSPHYRINVPLRRTVQFCRLNLMDRWPMKGPFDVIFCRNVMIYFDKPTQHRLIERFWEMLAPEGVLFIGHAESLASVRRRFRYLEPAVYQRESN